MYLYLYLYLYQYITILIPTNIYVLGHLFRLPQTVGDDLSAASDEVQVVRGIATTPPHLQEKSEEGEEGKGRVRRAGWVNGVLEWEKWFVNSQLQQ